MEKYCKAELKANSWVKGALEHPALIYSSIYARLWVNLDKLSFFDRVFRQKDDVLAFDLVFEEKDDKLIEIITGKEFKKYNGEMITDDIFEIYFKPKEELDVTEVAEYLKEFSEKDIKKIHQTINKIDERLLRAYKNYIEDMRQEEIDKENGIAYIKRFRNKYNITNNS